MGELNGRKQGEGRVPLIDKGTMPQQQNGGSREGQANGNGHQHHHHKDDEKTFLAASAGSSYTITMEEKKIGTWALAALVYFSVSGGPFGMEEAVSTAGPLVCLIGMGALPILWSLPEALITAELAPAFPEASGYVAWATHAFGPFWGFMKGYLSWLSGVTDNSLYPVLIVDYVMDFFKDEVAETGFPHGPYDRMLLLVGLTAVLTYLNYRGLDIVGKTAIGICGLSLVPFIIMVIVGLPQVKLDRLTALPKGGLKGVQWNAFVNMAFWNLNYYDNAAAFAGEVRNPGKSYPRAMGIAIVLVMVTTALPLLVGIGATDFPYEKWQDGFFATIAQSIVGKWCGAFIVFASAISSIGMFESEMSSDSFQLMGMAQRGMLPAVFARRSRFGTPIVAILLSAAGILGLVLLSFLEIVELLNFLYVLATLIEFAAFVKLRVSHPDLHRPFRIPLNTFGVCCMLLCPILLLGYVLVMASFKTWYICGTFVVFGCTLYHLLLHPTTRGCCKFLGNPHDDEVVEGDHVTLGGGEICHHQPHHESSICKGDGSCLLVKRGKEGAVLVYGSDGEGRYVRIDGEEGQGSVVQVDRSRKAVCEGEGKEGAMLVYGSDVSIEREEEGEGSVV